MKKQFNFIKEFIWLNFKSSIFGIYLISIITISPYINLPFISRYDFIFLSAFFFQIFMLFSKHERWKEFFVIIIFHFLATLMELFKTNPNISSWVYPEVSKNIFVILTVPLFTGFLYSAVGSYTSRAIKYLKLQYINFPKYHHLWIIAISIYINFFSHHYIYDFRYLIFLYILLIFWKTKVHFKIKENIYSIHFLLSGVLTAFFVWIAENIATFSKVWLYPHQMIEWHLVSIDKIGSWFLLLILSFALVTVIYKDKLYKKI